MYRNTGAALVLGLSFGGGLLAQETKNHSANADARSHPPARPLPTPARRERTNGPIRFVDAARGNDGASGTEQAPWRTLAQALRRLKPGDTHSTCAGGTLLRKGLSQRVRPQPAVADHNCVFLPRRAGDPRWRPARVPRNSPAELGAVWQRRRGGVRLDRDLSRRRRPPGSPAILARLLGADVGH